MWLLSSVIIKSSNWKPPWCVNHKIFGKKIYHKIFETFIFTNIIFNLNTLKAMENAWWKFISKMPPLLPNMLAFVLIKAAKQSYWWMEAAAHREISLILNPIRIFNDLGAHFLHWNQNPKFWVTWHISETNKV